MASVPGHVVQRVEAMLVEDEELLLVMQPARWRILRDAWSSLLFGLGGAVLTIWLLSLLNKTPLFTSPSRVIVKPGSESFITFVCAVIGVSSLLYCLTPIWAYRSSSGYIYALTNRRVILIEPLLFYQEKVRSYGKRDITQMKIKLYERGYGDLFFDARKTRQVPVQIGFRGIPKVEEVLELLLKTFDFKKDDFWKE